MEVDEVIQQLESLYDNSELSIDPFEPGSIWHKDLEALTFAIAVIKKAYQLDTE